MPVELNFNIYKGIEVKLDMEHRYEHVSTSVEIRRERNVTILWNQQVRTDRTIPDNKPDTIIPDNENGTYMLT